MTTPFMNRILVIFLIIASVASCASVVSNRESETPANAQNSIDPIDNDMSAFSAVINPEIPAKLTFAGQDFSFDRTDMYERLDRELASVAYTHGSTLLMIKRANKYFPLMAPILEKHGIPLDFLYLACVESSLNQRAVSPAKAAGFWQFMPSTAREYGLEVNDSVDERFNLEKATEAACRYLKSGYRRYGNWESVAASYNAGMTRISGELDRQGQDSALDLYLNEETSRYMFRIFAMKLILENPAAYGYNLRADQLYYPTPTRSIEVKQTINDLASWALENGTSYQWVKELNPWLRGRTLPNKSMRTYSIKVPADDNAISRPGTAQQKIFNKNFVSK